MNRMRALFLFLPAYLIFFTPPLLADTVLLKSGKRFENVSARPLSGGRLEVTFPSGRKLIFKKEQVQSLYIAPTRAAGKPGTGKPNTGKSKTGKRKPRKTVASRADHARSKRARTGPAKTKANSGKTARDEYLKDLAGRTITAKNLAAETMAADTMAAGKMHAETITARNIIARRITADTITAEVINARKIVSGRGKVLYSLEDGKKRAAKKPGRARPADDWSGWSLAVPGYRFGNRSHNWLLFGYLILGSAMTLNGASTLATAESDFDQANSLGVAVIAGATTFGLDQSLGLSLFRELRLKAADRGVAAANQSNLGALLILGAYLYNAWELMRPASFTSSRAPLRGAAVELNMNAAYGFAGTRERASELRVKWFLRF